MSLPVGSVPGITLKGNPQYLLYFHLSVGLCWFNPETVHHDFLLLQAPLPSSLVLVPREDILLTLLKSTVPCLQSLVQGGACLLTNQSQLEKI